MNLDDGDEQPLALWRRILLWTPGETGRGLRYCLLFTGSMLLIWGPAITYLKYAKPVFTSKWTLILPGTGINTSVSLDNIGKATTSSLSAYGGNSISPKSNYKSIAGSYSVLAAAAKAMEMDVTEFGKPRIKLLDQTSLIFFKVKGGSGEQAQKKSFALYESLEALLSRLRSDEIQRRENSVQVMLSGFRQKLQQTRDKLLAYQAQSEMVVVEQFSQLTSSLEQVKLQLIDLRASQAHHEGEKNRLIWVLKLNAEQASSALMLQTDLVFQENNVQYAQASALLARQSLRMGENHPEVVKTRTSWLAAKQQLEQRAVQLIGKRSKRTLLRLMLSSDVTRGALFERLIVLDAKSKGVSAKIKQLQQLIKEMVRRLNKDTEAVAALDDLQRNHQIAEAVFTSALARIDTGKTDIYASYPLIQMLTPPSVPKKPTTPNPLFVFIGAGLATSISLFGMLILWTRKPWLRKILLNE